MAEQTPSQSGAGMAAQQRERSTAVHGPLTTLPIMDLNMAAGDSVSSGEFDLSISPNKNDQKATKPPRGALFRKEPSAADPNRRLSEDGSAGSPNRHGLTTSGRFTAACVSTLTARQRRLSRAWDNSWRQTASICPC